jgi:uncharacterized protein YjdB
MGPETFTGATVKISNLAAGTWTFSVTGTTAAGITIVGGSAIIFIAEGENPAGNINLLPIAGTGILSVSVTTDAASILSGATLKPQSGSPSSPSFIDSGSVHSFSGTEAAGFYTLTFNLKEGNKTITVTELVQIYAGLTSSKALAYTAADFQAPPRAPSGLSVTSRGILSWTDNADTETAYFIERRSGTGSWAVLAGPLAANAVSYTDTVTYQSVYSYRVYAANSNGNSGYSNEVAFESVHVTGISLDTTSLSLQSEGTMGKLVATVSPINATCTEISWSTSNSAVATVSDTGSITPLAPGTAIITATTPDGGKKETCTVMVQSVPVTGISMAGTGTVGKGYTMQLDATLVPTNATNKSVKWSSSDTRVATVSSAGLVTGISIGSAIITVTTDEGGYTASSNITVDSLFHVVTSTCYKADMVGKQ